MSAAAGRFYCNLMTDATADKTTPGALGDILPCNDPEDDDKMDFETTLRCPLPPTSTVPRNTLCLLTGSSLWEERGHTYHVNRVLQLSSLNR